MEEYILQVNNLCKKYGSTVALDHVSLSVPTGSIYPHLSDPMGIVAFRKLILKLNTDRHITIIISSHILNELEQVATHYGFLHNGRMLKEICYKWACYMSYK